MSNQEFVDYRISFAKRFPYDATDQWWDDSSGYLPLNLPNMEDPAYLAARAIASLMSSSVEEPQVFSRTVKEEVRRKQIEKMAALIDAIYSGNWQFLDAICGDAMEEVIVESVQVMPGKKPMANIYLPKRKEVKLPNLPKNS